MPLACASPWWVFNSFAAWKVAVAGGLLEKKLPPIAYAIGSGVVAALIALLIFLGLKKG